MNNDTTHVLRPWLRRLGFLFLAMPLHASPIDEAFTRFSDLMTGPIAKSCSLVALVLGGLMIALDDGSSKRTWAGILFGLAVALGAPSVVAYFFS